MCVCVCVCYHNYARRIGVWRLRDTTELLPGDVFSVPDVGGAAHAASAVAAAATTGNDTAASTTGGTGSTSTGGANDDASGVPVPCDAVVLRGAAVVNEATLTGESIPQIKEALHVTSADASRALDINGEHRMHVLFSGTTVMQISGATPVIDESDVSSTLLRAPDGGCVCCCLRTGFGSSQGTLVRMIEFSSDAVVGSTSEALALLLILLVFALMASAYVLVTGLASGKRTQVGRLTFMRVLVRVRVYDVYVFVRELVCICARECVCVYVMVGYDSRSSGNCDARHSTSSCCAACSF